ncbi:MAG TPA: class I SAM-dependent methyltransferase [Gemmataceae bacterium]|nr:class I SAM-dependent methyltransferase [Gemmataceae bacterium]
MNSNSQTGNQSAFNAYADGYDAALDQGLSISGEDKNYFARGRIAWLAETVQKLQFQPVSALDFGCGIGSATPFLFDLLGVRSVVGLEVSSKSRDIAAAMHGSERAQFRLLQEYDPSGTIDLAFCNGVFHHIPVDQRQSSVEYVFRCIRPGGLFALWENNPWNPGTRLVMSRIPFDRDAVTLTPPETRRLLRTVGFEVIRTDFLFIFPRILKWLRWTERTVSRFPLGAQYMVLGRKPAAA